jgi:hypothetical protein
MGIHATWKQCVRLLFISPFFPLGSLHAQLPPSGPLAPRDSAIALPAPILASYVGYYQLGAYQVLSITVSGQQLFAQVSGQQVYPVYAKSTNEFFYQVANARMTFTSDQAGNVNGLTLQQGDVSDTAPLISSQAAQAVATARSARLGSLGPLSGSAVSLQSLLSGLATGNPDYSQMSQSLQAAVTRQLPLIQPWLQRLGTVAQTTFVGVSGGGFDVYRVTYANGSASWAIGVDASGLILGARLLKPPIFNPTSPPNNAL